MTMSVGAAGAGRAAAVGATTATTAEAVRAPAPSRTATEFRAHTARLDSIRSELADVENERHWVDMRRPFSGVRSAIHDMTESFRRMIAHESSFGERVAAFFVFLFFSFEGLFHLVALPVMAPICALSPPNSLDRDAYEALDERRERLERTRDRLMDVPEGTSLPTGANSGTGSSDRCCDRVS